MKTNQTNTARSRSLWTVSLGLLASLVACEVGIRDLDFESKQFTATFNVDSTLGIDSTSLTSLTGSKAIYSFSKDGKGTNHIQMGMLSKDIPFTWKLEGDSLRIDGEPYAVRKQDEGYMLKSDSVKIMLSQQP
ncbi:hypothetical protein [Spirosoma utsteinense]|uniref:Lipocalin-like domain-containing protein n=1 Tax=Spirosoma utsteinense TaxID=2585773 RepID=A0ABR6WCZ2_9BACT|nr:hypothetical protein [Spirosoma utsteinense]MBC3787494.1 hypothetical protein [Spirosoma utsteinense]MBC3794431.1 hypothetical protein [Spirosoma utsteinense]